MLHIDFVADSTDVKVIGITVNRGEYQTEIDLLHTSRKVVDGEICYDIWISDASERSIQEADEIVVGLSKDVRIIGYGISLNGGEVKPAVVFEKADYIDLPLSVCEA